MDKGRIKVLLLENDLMHYRIPVYNILAQKYDFTHACCYPKKIVDEIHFSRITFSPFRVGPFELQRNNLFELCQKYDVVIGYGDIHYLQYASIPLRPWRKFKFAFWGIGVSASYDKHFDTITRWDGVRDFFYKRADAYVFYTSYPIEKYVKRGFDRSALFVAPNTVEVDYLEGVGPKRNLLFIGTLYKEKGIQYLLDAYRSAYQIDSNIPVLDIIGDGPDFNPVACWIKESGLSDRIILHGAIYDKKIKASFFQSAIACISPLQAGLAVLESQGYGTAFITTKDAITGGEIFNISDGETGVLMDDVSELRDIILDIAASPEKYEKIGKNAREFYQSCRKPSDMAQGFIDVIDYMLSK